MKKILLTIAIAVLSANLSAQTLKFDFGSSEAQEGYTPVVSAQLYSETVGWGFEPGAVIKDVVNKKGTALTKDYVSSAEPFKFSVKLPEGSYRVKVTLGNTAGTSCTTIKSEVRRLHIASFRTEKGATADVVFNANIRTPKLSKNNEIKLNSREYDFEKGEVKTNTWDDKLTITFYDAEPCVCALEIEPVADDVVTVFVIGDSTVTDQASAGTWGQYLPYWFGDKAVVSNHAESGMTIKGFRFGRRWDKIMESCKEGDWLLIQLGTNDEKSRGHDPMWDNEDLAGDWVRTHSAADSDYIWELAAMAVEAKRHGVTPIIVSPMTKINRADGSATSLMTPYGINAPKAAELAQCPYVDLWGMSMDIVKALGAGSVKAYSDGTHTDNYGGYLFSLGIVNSIREQGLELAKYILPDTPAFDAKNPQPSFEEFPVPVEPRRMPQRPEGAPAAGRAPQGAPQQAPQQGRPEGWTPFGPL